MISHLYVSLHFNNTLQQVTTIEREQERNKERKRERKTQHTTGTRVLHLADEWVRSLKVHLIRSEIRSIYWYVCV